MRLSIREAALVLLLNGCVLWAPTAIAEDAPAKPAPTATADGSKTEEAPAVDPRFMPTKDGLRPILPTDEPDPAPEALYDSTKTNAAGQVVRVYKVYKDPAGVERKHGLAQWFYDDGVLKHEVTYRHDVPDGRERWWFPNGKLWMDFSNKYGKLNGQYQEFDRNGRLVRSERWADGKLVKSQH